MITLKHIGISSSLLLSIGGVVGLLYFKSAISNQQDSLISNPTNKETRPPIVQKTTLTSYLSKEGFEPLNTTETNDDWQEIFKGYRAAKEDTFKDLEETSEPALRKRCDKALKQEEGHEDYELARKWCVKKTTISNLLKKRGFRVLSASNNKDDQDWEKLANLPDNEASENRVSFASGINKVDSLKAVCKEFETLDTTADKFNEQLAIAEASCSIKDTISK